MRYAMTDARHMCGDSGVCRLRKRHWARAIGTFCDDGDGAVRRRCAQRGPGVVGVLYKQRPECVWARRLRHPRHDVEDLAGGKCHRGARRADGPRRNRQRDSRHPHLDRRDNRRCPDLLPDSGGLVCRPDQHRLVRHRHHCNHACHLQCPRRHLLRARARGERPRRQRSVERSADCGRRTCDVPVGVATERSPRDNQRNDRHLVVERSDRLGLRADQLHRPGRFDAGRVEPRELLDRLCGNHLYGLRRRRRHLLRAGPQRGDRRGQRAVD